MPPNTNAHIESVLDYLSSVLDRLGDQYKTLSNVTEAPSLVSQKGITWFRHTNRTASLVCFLKGIKLVSTLNGSICLLRAGHAQEVGALLRIADDCCSEILLLAQPGTSVLNPDQKQFLEDFFQEEFGDVENLLDSHQKRSSLPKRKIFAAFSNLAKDHLNSSDAQKTQVIIHATLSGYVHGAYPHVMELYGGSPPHFHLKGMLNTPRQHEMTKQMVTYVHRAAMASELVALNLKQSSVTSDLRVLRSELEKMFGLNANTDPKEIIRKMRSGSPKQQGPQ